MGIKDKKIEEIIAELPEEKYQQISFGDIYPTNIAPTMTKSGLSIASWGFRRYDNKGVLINARAENVFERNMFRASFLERRCVIPTSGFYEWDSKKQKYYFADIADNPLLLCGFYKWEIDRERFIILTKEATPPVDKYHERIPVICDLSNYRRYLQDTNFASEYILENNKLKLTTKLCR